MFPIPTGLGPLLRLQVVVAHPDDETFGCGSLLLHAAQAGAVTAVTCATRGEAGQLAPGVSVPGGDLGALREAELREAARLLGVRHVDVLGFCDSGLEGPAGPGTLSAVPETDVRAAVAASIEAFAPDVLVTLDGTDGHRDHERVREVTVGLGVALRLPVFLLGAPGEEESVEVDTGPFYAQRWEAIRAHRSQTSPFDGLPDDLARALLTREHLLAAVPAPPNRRSGEPEPSLARGRAVTRASLSP